MNGWEPANDVERALLEAAGSDDRQSYFQLIAVADLFLPQLTGDASTEQRFVTVHALDQVFLPVFTSVEALAGQFGHAIDGYTITNYPELRRKWPDPQWRLAINPGTPVDAYLSVDSLAEAAMGDVTVPTMAELYAASEQEAQEDARLRALRDAGDYPDEPEQALIAAARAGDVYGYLERLLDGNVLLPTTRPVPAESILDDGFPWRLGPGPTIEVFTGPAAFARSHTEPVPHVEVALAFALAMWPEGYGITVNPGGDDSIELPADQILWLLGFTSAAGPPSPD